MAGGLLDLEKHFAFYGAYHSNKVNVAIHTVFVWPIFFTFLLFLALVAPAAIVPLPIPPGVLPLQQFMVLNWAFVFAGAYALFYAALDKRAGSVAAALCLACWIGANALALRLGFSLGLKVVLIAQIVCWTSQFIGHGVFEKRAPALLDNLLQALVMAPFFVLLEVLSMSFSYEPYPGFMRSARSKAGAEIASFRRKKSR